MKTAISPFMRKLGNVVKIGQTTIPIQSLEEAVTLWNEARDFTEAKTGERFDWPGKIAFDGELYRISYNGRVWTVPEGVEVAVGGIKTAAQHDAEGWKDFKCAS